MQKSTGFRKTVLNNGLRVISERVTGFRSTRDDYEVLEDVGLTS